LRLADFEFRRSRREEWYRRNGSELGKCDMHVGCRGTCKTVNDSKARDRDSYT
jgi:hypothetical protein